MRNLRPNPRAACKTGSRVDIASTGWDGLRHRPDLLNRFELPKERITCRSCGSSSSSLLSWPSLATLAGDASLGSPGPV